jgi:hypothetical protein
LRSVLSVSRVRVAAGLCLVVLLPAPTAARQTPGGQSPPTDIVVPGLYSTGVDEDGKALKNGEASIP